ncbi:dihydrolipoyllysine-residue succinyltransferase component of 2-oxoglutarate dehydrogenase complex, mitochondrial [Lingula anatina]|uniref:Dihydrolipoyllysine-residue succinyltransferase component of 2-oxoglutarate dehydrogenase complex, mitochondrial n=1 Tax=Lingula anatina TaxID=7574 RepID=A0A1S3JBH3_LINAN|nr:dihydrolipoyllysine-residue succinyltransferase component of 2-oxoglutarate dehydrogenase complex, mitochondrial [Lingula anatina]|eukprot:XP_013407234.1 dihydrolipoyllysine-residue succinyltransferase component of 2-oxoglutarate dehydrogenase complex, mitochondrial [Lingula anatina]
MATFLASSRRLPQSISKFLTGRQVVEKEKILVTCIRNRSGISVEPLKSRNLVLSSRPKDAGSPKSHTSGVCRNFHLSVTRWSEVRVVNTPPFAESVTEGDVRWEKAVGDQVAEDEVVGEIETDKTSLPVHAPAAGIIEELLVEDGTTVEAGTALFKIRITGEAPAKKPEAAAEKAPSAEPAVQPPPAQPAGSASGPIPSSPPPIPQPPRQPMSEVPTASLKPTPVTAPSGGIASKPPAGTRQEQRIKMTRIRLATATRLKDAQNKCAMLTTTQEIDMSNLMEIRKMHQEAFVKKHGIKLGFMSAFVKASASALIDQPVVNAVIDEKEIVYRDYVDISVAVATPKGLVVPVIRNVETMNFADIELAINELGKKARDGQLAIEDMDGGTFTISNGGVFGSLFGMPIINLPQSAILGMHAIFDRPVAVNGKVEIRPMMYAALTYDHRLIDGREAVTFLRKIKSAVENPIIHLLGL